MKGSSAFIGICKKYSMYCATTLTFMYNVQYVLCDLPAQHGGMSGKDSGHINFPHPEHVVNDAWRSRKAKQKHELCFVPLKANKRTENKSLKQLNLVPECWKLLCFVSSLQLWHILDRRNQIKKANFVTRNAESEPKSMKEAGTGSILTFKLNPDRWECCELAKLAKLVTACWSWRSVHI